MEYAYLYVEPPRPREPEMKVDPKVAEDCGWIDLWDDGEDQKDQNVIIIQL